MRCLQAILFAAMLAAGVVSTASTFAKESATPKQEGRPRVRHVADPLPQWLKNKMLSNKTTDSAKTNKMGVRTATVNKSTGIKVAIPATMLQLPGNPPRVAPVVRDHTVTKPVTPAKTGHVRDNAIRGGGLGLDLNPFDFQAPVHFEQKSDQRTNPTAEWQSNSSGPANNGPRKSTFGHGDRSGR